MAIVQDLVVQAMWRDSVAHPGGNGPPVPPMPSLEEIFGPVPGTTAVELLGASKSAAALPGIKGASTARSTASGLRSTRSVSTLSGMTARSLASARASRVAGHVPRTGSRGALSTARSRASAASDYMHYRGDGERAGDDRRSDSGSSRPTPRSDEVALVEKEPTAVLQAYYALQADEEKREAKQRALREREQHMAFLRKQAQEAEQARRRQAEEDLRFAEAENAKAAALEAEERRRAEERRAQAVAAFHERERELQAERERKRAAREKEREEESRAARRAARLARQEEEAKQRAQAEYRAALVKSLAEESKRIAALRKAEASYTTAGVDPELIEAERQKLLRRAEAMEAAKAKYVADNAARQELAGRATLKMKEPQLRAIEEEEKRIEAEWNTMVKGWQDDLESRKTRAKQLELERLRGVQAQIAEREAARRAEAEAQRRHREELLDGARREAEQEAAKAAARKKKQQEDNEVLAAQLEAFERAKAAEGRAQLDVEGEQVLQQLKKDKRLLRKVKGRIAANARPRA